jgi:hypothetical protein
MNIDCAVLVLLSTMISMWGKIKDLVRKSATSAKCWQSNDPILTLVKSHGQPFLRQGQPRLDGF